MAVFLFAQAGIMATNGHAVPGGLNGVSSITWVVDYPPASKAIIACSYLFIASYSPTWGPVGWIYPTEIVPLYIRSKTISLATLFNWLANFSLTFFTLPGFQHIQWRLYCIFGTFCLCALIHVFLLFQETRGKSLEEMDDIFNNESIWAFRVKEKPSRLDVEIEEAKRALESSGDETIVKAMDELEEP